MSPGRRLAPASSRRSSRPSASRPGRRRPGRHGSPVWASTVRGAVERALSAGAEPGPALDRIASLPPPSTRCAPGKRLAAVCRIAADLGHARASPGRSRKAPGAARRDPGAGSGRGPSAGRGPLARRRRGPRRRALRPIPPLRRGGKDGAASPARHAARGRPRGAPGAAGAARGAGRATVEAALEFLPAGLAGPHPGAEGRRAAHRGAGHRRGDGAHRPVAADAQRQAHAQGGDSPTEPAASTWSSSTRRPGARSSSPRVSRCSLRGGDRGVRRASARWRSRRSRSSGSATPPTSAASCPSTPGPADYQHPALRRLMKRLVDEYAPLVVEEPARGRSASGGACSGGRGARARPTSHRRDRPRPGRGAGHRPVPAAGLRGALLPAAGAGAAAPRGPRRAGHRLRRLARRRGGRRGAPVPFASHGGPGAGLRGDRAGHGRGRSR